MSADYCRSSVSAIGTSSIFLPCSSMMATNQPSHFHPGISCRVEVAGEVHGILARGGVAGKIDAFVVVEDFFAVGEMEIIARHGCLSRVDYR